MHIKRLRGLVLLGIASNLFLASKIVSQPRYIANSNLDSGLVEKCIKSRFKTYFDKSQIDTMILNHFKEYDDFNCFANPKENFNATDLRLRFLCNYRLIFYSISQDKNVLVILYQAGSDGAPIVDCEIYGKFDQLSPTVLKIEFSDKVRTQKQFKEALISNQYWLPPKYSRNIKN